MAREAIADENRERADAGLPRIEYGIALHVGDVMYGNIGSKTRLDFTVIGPAVNLSARIETLWVGRCWSLPTSSAPAASRPKHWVRFHSKASARCRVSTHR